MANKTFNVEFNMDNAAFEEDQYQASIEILKGVIERLEAGRDYGFIYDSNGNRIGNWDISSIYWDISSS